MVRGPGSRSCHESRRGTRWPDSSRAVTPRCAPGRCRWTRQHPDGTSDGCGTTARRPPPWAGASSAWIAWVRHNPTSVAAVDADGCLVVTAATMPPCWQRWPIMEHCDRLRHDAGGSQYWQRPAEAADQTSDNSRLAWRRPGLPTFRAARLARQLALDMDLFRPPRGGYRVYRTRLR